MATAFTEDNHKFSRDAEQTKIVKHIVSLDGFGHRRDTTLYETQCRACGLSFHHYVENPPI